MSKRKAKRSKPRPALPELPEESRSAEAATIGWMLSAMVALCCELGWVVARWWSDRNPELKSLGVMSDLLFLSSLVVGLVVLVLVPVVLKSRRVLPPRGITVFAVVIGAAPLLIAAWRWVS